MLMSLAMEMRRISGRSGEAFLFYGWRVLSEPARLEIVLLLKPRGVWIQEVSDFP